MNGGRLGTNRWEPKLSLALPLFSASSLSWPCGSGRILGVHIIGPHATDLIAKGELAIRQGAAVRDLARTIHAHPTLAEIMLEASFKAISRSLHGQVLSRRRH